MNDDDETVREAKRTLERIGQEGGLSATPVDEIGCWQRARSFRRRCRQERSGGVWGTRIARALALVALVWVWSGSCSDRSRDDQPENAQSRTFFRL
jgi:hypothetical protein